MTGISTCPFLPGFLLNNVSEKDAYKLSETVQHIFDTWWPPKAWFWTSHCDSCLGNTWGNDDTERTLKEVMVQLCCGPTCNYFKSKAFNIPHAWEEQWHLSSLIDRFPSPHHYNLLKCTEICAVWQQCPSSFSQIPSNLSPNSENLKICRGY